MEKGTCSLRLLFSFVGIFSAAVDPCLGLSIERTKRKRYESLAMSSLTSNDGHQPLAPIFPPLAAVVAQSTESVQEYSHHLVVHFDINETILVGDEAGGDTREDCLNKVLAKSAFVRIPSFDGNEDMSCVETDSIVPTHWWDGSPIVPNGCTGEATSIPPLYIAWEWPPGCCPYYRTAFKYKSKTFVQHDGSPYRSTLHKIEEALHHKYTPEIPALGNMLPSFFLTLQWLSRTLQQKTIVFRTFGTDLPEIAKAVTAFAQGRHPDYPDFKDNRLIMHPDCIVQGRWQKNTDGTTIYQLFRAGKLLASGDREVLDFIHSHTVCGIEDDYIFWDSNGCLPSAGKPVWKLPDVHHVLLDDNIHNLAHDAIASVRSMTASGSFETLTGREIQQEQGKHLIRVPTLAPILHPGWFREVIECAQKRFVESQNQSC